MASNTNMFFSNTTTSNGLITFARPADHLNVYVAAGATFTISFDGTNYLSLPVGFSSFKIGVSTSVSVVATGTWQMVAVEG